jgi:hypothetical protein
MSCELTEKRGQRRCETFSFLGFTHIELREQTWHRMHAPTAVQHRWLCAVIRGHS